MLDLLIAGGWLMIPLLLCSVLATAIILERFWTLRVKRVVPAGLLQQTLCKPLTPELLQQLRQASSLGRILAAGLSRRGQGATRIREALQAAGSHEVHQLERFLSPLGTVIGMIDIFQQLDLASGNTAGLASGISMALITTATGLTIAIPALVMHRYFLRRVSDLVVALEEESQKLLDRLTPEKTATSLELQLDQDVVETPQVTTSGGWS